jgi:hypothetical protein
MDLGQWLGRNRLPALAHQNRYPHRSLHTVTATMERPCPEGQYEAV